MTRYCHCVPPWPAIEHRERKMLGIAAAVLFFIAFILNATETSVDSAVLGQTSLMLLGLTLLALHVAGIGSGWATRGRRR
jgi:hypothetical protein